MTRSLMTGSEAELEIATALEGEMKECVDSSPP